jgi:hypothetical protein
MSPSRGVRLSAFTFLVLAAAMLAAVPARASVTETIDAPADPLARSPRLVGMGRISWVLEDVNRRISLWELGRNLAGIATAESVSTVEISPFLASVGTRHDLRAFPGASRQELATREMRTAFEAWRRGENTTYGAYGDFIAARDDAPYDGLVERRAVSSQPSLTAALSGRMPYLWTERMRYGLRISAADRQGEDTYRLIVRNPAGEFVDVDGALVGPPDQFEPDDVERVSLGFGAAVGYDFGRALNLGLGFDYETHDIQGVNEAARHASEIIEERPYRIGQASLVGMLGRALQWGIDARGWKSSSEQTWAFTTSAGVSTDPLTGRGKLLDRDEEGSRLIARVRWTGGPFQIGAGYGTSYRQIEITPPASFDAGSFNRFISDVFHRAGADTIALPDSVVASVTEDRSIEGGGGVAWTSGRWTVAVEGNYSRTLRDRIASATRDGVTLVLAGSGPRSIEVEARTGFEWHVLDALRLRGGYDWARIDRDDFTEATEYVAHGPTAGLGFRPAGVDWAVDLGYGLQWTGRDFDDPEEFEGHRQRLAARMRWSF